MTIYQKELLCSFFYYLLGMVLALFLAWGFEICFGDSFIDSKTTKVIEEVE